MLSLVAERANRSVAARWRTLGLDEAVYARARAAILERLADGPATRAQLREALAAGGVDASGQRLPHLLRRVAFEGRLHHPLDGTFAALEPARAAAARRGARRARPPLRRRLRARPTRRDLATFWAGVAARPTRAPRGRGEAAAGGAATAGGAGTVRLLGSFDPYLLGYAGREHAVAPEHARRVWPGGGWIHPVVLVDGRAAGTWRLDGAALAVDALAPIPGDGLEAEAQDVARFLGRTLAVSCAG